jgi:hypothetical protein
VLSLSTPQKSTLFASNYLDFNSPPYVNDSACEILMKPGILDREELVRTVLHFQMLQMCLDYVFLSMER